MKIPQPISYVAALGLLAGVLTINFWLAKPFYNWDLLAYVGVAIAYTENTPEAIHAQTFSTAKAHVPEAAFNRLITANAYQIAMAKYPQYFIQQLPFYRVKPLYPALMFLMSRFGVNLVATSVLIPKVAYIGIGLLLYLWAAGWLHPMMAFAVTSLMVSTPHAFNVARYSTPDALSTMLLLAAFFLLIERRAIRSSLALLTVAITIRPDNILLLLLTALYIAIFYKSQRLWAAGSSLFGIALFVSITTSAGGYGWTTLFYHSFVEHLLAPSGFTSPLSLGDYLRIYLFQANPRTLENIVLFTLLNVFAISLYCRQPGTTATWFHLLIVNSLFMLEHWLLFPGEKDRHFVAFYLLILMGLVRATKLPQRVGRSRAGLRAV